MSFPSIKVSAKGGTDFTPVPQGAHYAICIGVVDLGNQKTTYKGDDKVKHQVYLRFELPDEAITYTKNGKEITGPSTIGRTFGLTIGDKSNLGPFLEGWRGSSFTPAEKEGFDITSIIGKVCQVGVTHETRGDKTYANITTALPLMKAQRLAIEAEPKLAISHNELVVYSPDAHDEAVFQKLPEWLRTKINARVVASVKPASSVAAKDEDEFNDEIPF